MKKDTNFFSKLFAKPSEVTVYMPEEITITFDGLIGLENAKDDLKDVVTYIKDPASFDKLGIRPHMHYLIQGPPGNGKTSLAYAVAREANIPIVVVNCKAFADEKSRSFKLLKAAFAEAASFDHSVLLFKNFEGFFQVNDSFKVIFLGKLLELMRDCENVVVISTLSAALAISGGDYLFDEDAFSKTIDVLYPDLKTREAMYELFCTNIPVDKNVSFARLARDSYNMTAQDIKQIIKNSALLAIRNNCDTVTREHFDEMISLELLGQKRKKMTDKERRCTAYHEAGHVIAHYFNDPNYKLSKVEVAYRTESLGVTMEEVDEDKLSLFKTDWENRIIGCFGGMAAERAIFGANTSGVVQDLASATFYAKLMVAAFGMCDEFGPMSICEVYSSDDDESAFRFSEHILEECDKHVRNILQNLYNRAYQTVTDHRAELEALTEALLENEVVYGNEIKEIFDKISQK